MMVLINKHENILFIGRGLECPRDHEAWIESTQSSENVWKKKGIK